MFKSLIEHIKNQTITNRWMNKVGAFEYDEQGNYYRFIETNQDATQYIIPISQRSEENTPIIIKGFIAFLIANWGNPERQIYSSYNERCRKQFISIESKKAGSYKRDLNKEFPIQLLNSESSILKEFIKDFHYLHKEDKELILEYANNYIEYTTSVYEKNKSQEGKDKTFTTLLSHNNIEKLMIVLHEQIEGAKGKKVAAIIKALQELNLLKPYDSVHQLFKLIQSEFGDIGTVKNFRNYINNTTNYNLEQSTIDSYKKIFQEI